LRAQKETPTARELREAEIELARAKLQLTERQLAQKASTEGLAEAQKEFDEITNGAKEGTDRYTEAMKALNEAKEAQDAASKKVQDALEDEREAIDKVTEAQEKLRDATWAVFDAEKALEELRKSIPKSIRRDAREDFDARETGFAPGVMLPILPDVAGLTTAMNAPITPAVSQIVINSESLDPAAAQQYVVDALRGYERSNGFIPIRVDSAVYAV